MEKEPVSKLAGRKRLILLLLVLALVVAGGITHYGRVWYYERQLLRIAQEIVTEANRNDPLPMSAEGPEADVEIKVSCSFAYLLFGPKTGKITLIIKPRPHASNARIRGLVYLYRHDAGAWEEVESYHM